jgi:four helix bundle protein
MQDFSKLKVWQKAHTLTLEIYRETLHFPQDEKFGLTGQLRRASSSIGANLAEGCGRFSPKDKARFFNIALGSACEAQYHLLLAKDLNYLPADNFQSLDVELVEIKKMLTALIQKLITDH